SPTRICGGTRSGNCARGKTRSAMRPPRTVRIAITMATMGHRGGRASGGTRGRRGAAEGAARHAGAPHAVGRRAQHDRRQLMASFFINRPIVAMVIAILTVLGGLIALRVLPLDRKSTRLNSSHGSISYAVFCL